MKDRPTLDVSHLPPYAFGHRSLLWWGTMGMIAIEGMVFALGIAAYFYLRNRSALWPPGGPPPALFYGTLNTVIMLISVIPNAWLKRRAEKEDLRAVQIGLVICLVLSIVFLVIRVYEFKTLNCKWDTNAYGSAVWSLLGFHTVHLLTDTLDTVVITVLMFTSLVEGKRFVDVSEYCFYWYFVVLSWVPIYAVIYLAPRLL
ncbi:MAG TPA: cytochrome c oxidase subunit 3 [Blastocatellia bacterium]|jgi:heme/copper-type cytochrome/quinol oxidase subunit 3